MGPRSQHDEIAARWQAPPEHVSVRPGVFGDIEAGGVLQLVMQLLDAALDRHLAGQVERIEISIHDDHFCIRDDGPGISAADLSPGLAGMCMDGTGSISTDARLGLGLVNSLAQRLEIVSCRYGARRRWLFEDFTLHVDGEHLGSTDASGTLVRVWPDPRVFARTRPDRFALEHRLRGVHRVRPSLALELDGQRFDEPAGAEAWIAAQRCSRGLVVEHVEARRGTTELELAWAWLPAFGSARRLSYVNLAETLDDGSHVDGLLDGLARAHAVPLALARERTLALVSVIAVNPHFAGPTRARLDDPALARWISDQVVERVAVRSQHPLAPARRR